MALDTFLPSDVITNPIETQIKERRAGQRGPVAGRVATARITFGSTSMPAHLVNASNGGFALNCPTTVSLDVNDVVCLHTGGESVIVRIVRSTISQGEQRIGVERLPEAAISLMKKDAKSTVAKVAGVFGKLLGQNVR